MCTEPMFYVCKKCGNLVGMIIEEKLAAGWLAVRIITQKRAAELEQALKDHGYGVTTLSLPSLIMLRKAIKPKLLALFIAICTLGFIIVGYFFNFLQGYIL